MNLLDRIISSVSPRAGLKRAQYRKMLAAYDAATSSNLRKFSRDNRSGEALARLQGKALRQQARELDRNHDLARGALSVMCNNIVGPAGIGIEPQPRSVSGEIYNDLSEQLLSLWRDWSRFPEVTYGHDWVGVQHLMCRSWLRDGEAFAQILEGMVPGLDHRTEVPLSIEMLEADMIPTEYDAANIRNGQGGIVRNAWGQVKEYQAYKVHPGDTAALLNLSDLKTIPADRMIHLRRVDRIGQVRGVSEFASVITRLEDLKDYEESERIAAKIAASMAAAIIKNTPDIYEPPRDETGAVIARSMRFQPGMIFDDLMPGEQIQTIDTNRPNTSLLAHRQGQLKAFAAGLGVSYSSSARDYSGTYSSQRQELVEQDVHYQKLTNAFTSQFVRHVWERFVKVAIVSGAIKVPADAAPGSIDDAMYIGQSMPWIDPLKEASANEALERNIHKSAPEIIRGRGGNPKDVLAQQAKWMRMREEAGLSIAHESVPPGQVQADDEKDAKQ